MSWSVSFDFIQWIHQNLLSLWSFNSSILTSRLHLIIRVYTLIVFYPISLSVKRFYIDNWHVILSLSLTYCCRFRVLNRAQFNEFLLIVLRYFLKIVWIWLREVIVFYFELKFNKIYSRKFCFCFRFLLIKVTYWHSDFYSGETHFLSLRKSNPH